MQIITFCMRHAGGRRFEPGEPNGGSASVLLRPSMTQRYKWMAELAGETPKQRGDIVFDYSNVNEGN